MLQAAQAAVRKTGFAFPVLVGHQVVGLLEFFSRHRMEATASFLDAIAGIGTQLGRVVERKRATAAMQRSEQPVLALESHGRRGPRRQSGRGQRWVSGGMTSPAAARQRRRSWCVAGLAGHRLERVAGKAKLASRRDDAGNPPLLCPPPYGPR